MHLANHQLTGTGRAKNGEGRNVCRFLLTHTFTNYSKIFWYFFGLRF